MMSIMKQGRFSMALGARKEVRLVKQSLVKRAGFMKLVSLMKKVGITRDILNEQGLIQTTFCHLK
eukprot:3767069-Pyramimonas_sp.AAC.1